MTATKQGELHRDDKGRITGGTPPVGFHTNPERRNDGRWNKEDSISYQYNKLLRMSPEALQDFKAETVAQQIAFKRLMNAITDDGLNDTKEVTDRTEGKAPQFIGVGGENEYKKALVEFINTSDDINDDSNKNNN